MLADKILCQCQPQPVSIGATGNERVKYFIAQMSGYAGTIVGDLHHHGETMQFFHQRDLAGDPRA